MNIDYSIYIDDDCCNNIGMINRMKSLNEDEFIRDVMFINSQKHGATVRIQRYSEDNSIDIKLVMQENICDDEYDYKVKHDYSDICWIDYFECKFEKLENEFTEEIYNNLKKDLIYRFFKLS